MGWVAGVDGARGKIESRGITQIPLAVAAWWRMVLYMESDDLTDEY